MLGANRTNLGLNAIESGRDQEGLEHLQRAVESQSAILARLPGHADVRTSLAIAVNGLAFHTGRTGKPEQTAQILASFPPIADTDQLGKALSITSIAISVLQRDPNREANEVEELTDELAELAADLLARSTAEGFRDHDVLRTDAHFRTLRSEPTFAEALARY